jgi:nitrate/TMAO reductase-like tetraheme cytochrome c subunit
MPVDDSLPDDPALSAQFRDTLSSRIDAAAGPSQRCIACHATAAAAWAASRHARALDSLRPDDRTDSCIACHVTLTAPATVAPGVSCQSCHQGGDAHAASGGTLRTGGTSDCRSCHDAKHHPTFRRDLAWPRIQHGREPARP